ncbi:MAG: hypothetical protein NTW19_05230 [Planctomycetota bacterium]|nr:hypothetical protein [Planctomycetota bacterium]
MACGTRLVDAVMKGASRMGTRPWLSWTLFVAAVVVTGIVMTHSFYSVGMAGLEIYDRNVRTFEKAFTEEQGKEIVAVALRGVDWALYPLILTNVLWIVAAGVLLKKRRATTESAPI